MLCCVKISAQSLEAIAFIVAESAGRISECCTHVGMQIYSGSDYCTSPSSHRRIPPRLNYSPLFSEALGAMIIQLAPPIPHSKTLDNFCVQVLQLFTGCFSSSLPLKPALSSLCCHLWTSFKTKLSRVWSQDTPTFLLHSQLSLESLFLATLQGASTNLQQPASFLTRYIQQQATYDRTGRWETHGYAHTHAAASGCSHRDETFPKRVNHRTIQVVHIKVPM